MEGGPHPRKIPSRDGHVTDYIKKVLRTVPWLDIIGPGYEFHFLGPQILIFYSMTFFSYFKLSLKHFYIAEALDGALLEVSFGVP